MAREGDIVFGHGRQMKIGLIFREFASCIWFDNHGRIRKEWFEVKSLMSLDAVLRPRSLWPEAGSLEKLEAERQERVARIAEIAERAARRKVARANKRRAA